MGLFKNMSESFRRIKTRNPEVYVEEDIDSSFQKARNEEILSFIDSTRRVSDNRKIFYSDLEAMAHDSLIGSALELICDDVVQEDTTTGRVFWVSCDEEKDEKVITPILNQVLLDMKVDDNAWAYIYNILVYGGVMLKTYESDFTELKKLHNYPKEIVSKRGYLFEICHDYYTVADLQKYGDTVGYCMLDTDKHHRSKRTTIYPVKDYIHILNDKGVRRERITLETKDGEEEFSIRFGTSYLEVAREAFKIIDLVETLILLSRFNKSAFYRLFKIEVGSADRSETARIIRDIRQKISTTDGMDIKERTYSATKKPLPYGQNVYITTRQGKGEVNIDTIGGDYDIKDIYDLDYWRNKLFAALRIPKAFLGYEETVPGGIGNQSLTRIDIRYARLVKRYKKIGKTGVKDMLDYWCDVNGHEDWKDKFTVETSKVLTADEADFKDEVSASTNLATTLIELVKSILSEEEFETLDSKQILKVIFEDILGIDQVYYKMFLEGNNEKNADE